jgi:hypothetical protein
LLVLTLTAAGIACSGANHTPGPTSPTLASADSLDYKGGGRQDIPVTTTIVDQSGDDILSDGQGAYANGAGGVSSILTINGYNGINWGDWQFTTLNSSRTVGHTFDPTDAVEPIISPAPPFSIPAQLVPSRIEVQCTWEGKSMLIMTALSQMTCGLSNRMDYTDGVTYRLNADLGRYGDPVTTDASVTCNGADATGCNDWTIRDLGPSIGRFFYSTGHPSRTYSPGHFRMHFEIHVTRP